MFIPGLQLALYPGCATHELNMGVGPGVDKVLQKGYKVWPMFLQHLLQYIVGLGLLLGDGSSNHIAEFLERDPPSGHDT